MALFGKKKKKIDNTHLPPPGDPKWARGAEFRFPNFLEIDPDAAGLNGVSAVYAIWHTGNRPGWVYIGFTDNLADALYDQREDPDVIKWQNRGDLYCSWCLIKKELQIGVTTYLNMLLKPHVANPDVPPTNTLLEDLEVQLTPVYPPGMNPKNKDEKIKQEEATAPQEAEVEKEKPKPVPRPSSGEPRLVPSSFFAEEVKEEEETKETEEAEDTASPVD